MRGSIAEGGVSFIRRFAAPRPSGHKTRRALDWDFQGIGGWRASDAMAKRGDGLVISVLDDPKRQ
ncbi:hypothetical protein PDR5_10950 [Pseudomonas sp. DR 5-09]|nr:hypothetical protein PDR5_10950 [Pseudomonas sp. DR 5-09]